MARHVALMHTEILCSCTARHCTARSFRPLITTSGQLTGYAWQRSDEFRLYRQSSRRFSSNKVVSRLKPAGPVSGQLRPEMLRQHMPSLSAGHAFTAVQSLKARSGDAECRPKVHPRSVTKQLRKPLRAGAAIAKPHITARSTYVSVLLDTRSDLRKRRQYGP